MAYSRARAAWHDDPVHDTLVRAQDLEQWEDALNQLKNVALYPKDDFGVTFDGTTDDSTAWQDCLDEVSPSSVVMVPAQGTSLVPSGGLTCSSTVAMRGPGIRGYGSYGSQIKMTASSGTLLTLSGPGSSIEGVVFTHPNSGTRNSDLIGVSMTNANFNTVDKSQFIGFSTNLKVDTGTYPIISRSDFRDFVLKGIDARYTGGPDAGCPRIETCTFDRTNTDNGGTAIYGTSIGGLQVIHPTIESSPTHSFDYGVLFEVGNGQTSTFLEVQGGGIEGFRTAGVAIRPASGATSGVVDHGIISDVLLSGLNNAGSIGILMDGFLQRAFTINSNTFNTLATGADLTNCDGFSMDGNTHTTPIAAGKGTILRTGCTGFHYGLTNRWGGMTAGNELSISADTTGMFALNGSGSPEGVYAAVKGSTYQRRDGGAGTSFYVKESLGVAPYTTGWVGK